MAVELNTNSGAENFKTTGSGTIGDPHVSHTIIDNAVTISGDVNVTTMPDVSIGAGSVVEAKDGGPNYTPLRARLSSADVTSAATVVAAPGAGSRIVIWDAFISTDTNLKITIRDDDPTVYLAGFFTASNGIEPIIPRSGLRLDENEPLQVIADGAGNVEMTFLYTVETV